MSKKELLITFAVMWAIVLGGTIALVKPAQVFAGWNDRKPKNESCCFRDYQGTVHCLPCVTYNVLRRCL